MDEYAVCATCGVQFATADPGRCPVCEDARQYVPQSGQRWTTLAELRREWVMRPSPRIEHWRGETRDLGEGLTLVRCGGHFAGGQVLHVEPRRALLSGDIVQVIPDRAWVSFMFSYPNLIPLSAGAVLRIAESLEPFAFDTILGAWWERLVPHDGSGVVRRSAERYVRGRRRLLLASRHLVGELDEGLCGLRAIAIAVPREDE